MLKQLTNTEYAFVVVGGGSAGCLLARLLAEQNRGPVALLEAGTPTRDVRTQVPVYYPHTFGSNCDWSFVTEPQSGLNGRRIPWPRGKTLGGCSAINALIHLQAATADFDRWRASGCTGIAEGWQGPIAAGRSEDAGNPKLVCPVAGLPLSTVAAPHPWTNAFLDAAESWGLERVSGWTQARNRTSGLFALTQLNGRRSHVGQSLSGANDTVPHSRVGLGVPHSGVGVGSPESGSGLGSLTYVSGWDPSLTFRAGIPHSRVGLGFPHSRVGLKGESRLENLDVYTGCSAVRVEVRTDRVTGIELVDEAGEPVYLPITGKVILTAGTIGTPSILLRSGIGPAMDLRALGIDVQLDLPGVGANLLDHLVYPVVYATQRADGLPRRFSRAERQQYREQGRGPLASNIAEAGALFSQVDSSLSTETAPDFQIHFTPTHYLKYPISNSDGGHLSLAVTDLHPRSRGRLRLTDRHPHSPPQLDPAYLDDPQDIARLLAAVQACRELATQPSLKSLISEEALPGAKRLEPKAIERSVRMFAQSIYHPVGTCRMGSDALAVVNNDFQVASYANLLVADASVLPDLPSANTNAVTLLVAATLARRLA